MNFLAHYVVAARSLTPKPPLSAYVIGTALPDLLPLAEKRVRLRPARIAETTPHTPFEVALGAGVLVHLATDAAFHKSTAFGQAQAEVIRILTEADFDGMRVRRFFVSHVLTELALDAVLLRADTTLADGFYEAFAPGDFAAVTRWSERVTGRPLPHLPEVLTRFASSRYLRHYAEDGSVATGLAHLCRRARQDTFDGKNFDRLIGVAEQVMALLPRYVPALLSETAAGVLLSMQEEA